MSGRGEFYRQCRIWHGYLSAFAFLALLFFAATGVLLNHPTWLRGELPPRQEQVLRLAPGDVAAVRAAPEPARRLEAMVRARQPLVGAFKSGEADGDQIFVRLQGVRGSSDLKADLAVGEVQVTTERETGVGVLNALHRGELAGPAWRRLIDLFGAVLIALALIGYVLFLSLRFRLRTALGLTALSLALMVGVFVVLTP